MPKSGVAEIDDALYAVVIVDQAPSTPTVTVYGPTRSRKKADLIAEEFAARERVIASVEPMTPAPRLSGIPSLS